MALAGATAAYAQTTLQGQIVARPMSNDDRTAYSLPATVENSGGLSTVGLGQPAYLEAEIDISVAASDITGVTWTLTGKPSGSSATLADSPLGIKVPIWEPSDRLVLQVAGRKLLRPDVVGQYTITAAVATAKSGTANLTYTLTAGTYKGIQSCSLCHNGKIAPDTASTWAKTLHSEIFKDNINGANGDSYTSSCWGCHTVGYDTNTTAANGGFDKVMASLGWTPPAHMVAGNWDKVPTALQNVANIQCENCHGPGSQHIANGGSKAMISVSMGSGDCGQCHGAASHHIKTAEWDNSMHAVTTRDPSGAGREGCVGCHTGSGFMQRMAGAAITNTDFMPINCQTCHDPHGQTTPGTNAHLVRNLTPVTLADGTQITDGGTGMLCMNCHQSRQNAAVYASTTAGSSHFGPHHGPQADMLAGANGYTYGHTIPSSAHGSVVKDACVTCHMQTVAPTDAGFLNVGGHTFKPGWTDPTTNNKVQLVAACQGCHGPDVTSFDFQLFDYNDDGNIDGVQTEVQSLMDQLSAMLPPVGQVKSALNIDATWTQPQLEAAYNWLFVSGDGSKGVHNTAYAVGLLKASINDLKNQKK
jgi:hypothetical protein